MNTSWYVHTHVFCYKLPETSHTLPQTLTNIAALINDHKIERKQQTGAAKTRAATETAAVLELCDAAMKGTVRHETLIDVSELDGSTLRKRQGQRKCSK
jgi:hypothetical protein